MDRAAVVPGAVEPWRTNRIFERFHQVEGATGRSREGTGIGFHGRAVAFDSSVHFGRFG